jgi:hypothetical protein
VDGSRVVKRSVCGDLIRVKIILWFEISGVKNKPVHGSPGCLECLTSAAPQFCEAKQMATKCR